MPSWSELRNRTKAAAHIQDTIRREALHHLHELTGRNVIIYYSGWLQRRELFQDPRIDLGINDQDKNGFMSCIHELNRKKGLDLLLHTPGGDAAATESLVDYLRSMFGTNIRAIIPHIAMSGGTMVACACKEILMGKHSNLGPIDPLFRSIPAHGIIEEFERARDEIESNPSRIPLWQPILAKYHPTLIGECEKALAWSQEMVTDWLITGMFKRKRNAKTKANDVVSELADHPKTKSHARHISTKQAKKIGLKIVEIEKNDDLQDAILTIHHACVLTFEQTDAYKIIENHNDVASISTARIE